MFVDAKRFDNLNGRAEARSSSADLHLVTWFRNINGKDFNTEHRKTAVVQSCEEVLRRPD
jgi:hypothetical protein